ncbi:MAG: tyrosine-type recombinase/integrase [Nannocystales bacterium]
MGDLVRLDTRGLVPAAVGELGRKAERKFVEFFTAHLRNDHTRRAYAHAAAQLSEWLAANGLSLAELEPSEAAAYIKSLEVEGKAPTTIKARLSALSNLCDYLASSGVLDWNPFKVVRGPRVSQREGQTPVLEPEMIRALLDSFEGECVVALRDRAIVSTMLFSFARVGAVTKLDGRHYEVQGVKASLLLHEKRGKKTRVPCHHELREAIDAFVRRSPAGPRTPLFRSVARALGEDGERQLTRRRLKPSNVLDMVKKRCAAVGIDPVLVCNHSFRASGITAYMAGGGSIETAAEIAGHASTETTKLYDRTAKTVSRSEIERIRF